MDKPQPPKPPQPKPAPATSELGVVVRRCPFCHEGLGGLIEGVVSCAACDARHHTACWDDHQACASCGGAARLVLESHPVASPARRSRRPQILGALAALAVLLAVIAGVVFDTFQQQARDQALRAAYEADRAAREQDAARERAAHEQRARLLVERAEAEARQREQDVKEAALQRDERQRERGEAVAAARAVRLWSGLGVRGVDAGGFRGVRIDAVRPDSPAAHAGLTPGDHLTELLHAEPDGRAVHDARTRQLLEGVLLLFVEGDDAGDWSLRVERDGALLELPLPRR